MAEKMEIKLVVWMVVLKDAKQVEKMAYLWADVMVVSMAGMLDEMMAG